MINDKLMKRQNYISEFYVGPTCQSDMDIFSTINSPLKMAGDLNLSQEQNKKNIHLYEDDKFDQILSSDGLDSIKKPKSNLQSFSVD